MNTVLETRNLVKRYRGATALDGVNIVLERGRIYGFVGNNGAGKTTLMRIVAGLASPSGGEVLLFGEGGRAALERARRRTGFLIEEPVYYADMSARQNLEMQCVLRGAPKHDALRLLEEVGLSRADARKSVRKFSTGMRQRYGLAFSMVGDPEFLVLDEPLSGIDVEGMDDICELLTRKCREDGVTILLSSHQLARLESVATDYIFLDWGRVIETDTAEELMRRAGPRELEDYFRDLVKSAREAERK